MWGYAKPVSNATMKTSFELDTQNAQKLKAPCRYRGFMNSTYTNRIISLRHLSSAEGKYAR